VLGRIFCYNFNDIKRKRFFFEKRIKTFVNIACANGEARDSDTKVFCFFSSEKKTFLMPQLQFAGQHASAATRQPPAWHWRVKKLQ